MHQEMMMETIPIEHLKRNCQLFLQVSIDEFRRQLETFMLTTIDTLERQYKEAQMKEKVEEQWSDERDRSEDSQAQSSVAAVGAHFDFEEGLEEVSGAPETAGDLCSAAADLNTEDETMAAAEVPAAEAVSASVPEDPFLDLKDPSLTATALPIADEPFLDLKDPSMAVAAAAASAAAAAAAIAVPAPDFPLALCTKASPMGKRRECAADADATMEASNDRLWCRTCDISFSEALPFELHVQSHELDRKCMKCFHCGKSFASFSNLKRHKKIHTGVRPHVCAFCARPFLNRSDLVRHWRIHTGERPYRCDVCQHAFKYSFNLKTHQQKYHNHA